jgi:creatinine amidohydrolase/Fe(II)-dependent formamide hydrolase-like protein
MPLNVLKTFKRRSDFRLILSLVFGFGLAASLVLRPLTAPLPSQVDLSEMTWVEVRTAIEHGYTTVIVPSGGLEQNGVHMVIGKHDHIVRFAARQIAGELGKTLVTPVVSYVPEGPYDPPGGHMRYPGTIGVPEDVFAGILDGIARSLKATGFKTICFIADHGGSARAQADVVQRLNREWKNTGVQVVDVADYYSDARQIAWLKGQGETIETIGEHAGILDTSELLSVRSEAVDLARIASASMRLEHTGGTGRPERASAERGKALLAMRIDAAARQIRASLSAKVR